MENGLGNDEYILLTKRIGAVPAITVALQFGTPQEIADTRDWVDLLQWQFLDKPCRGISNHRSHEVSICNAVPYQLA